jgi:hypothetical protein
VAQGVDPEFKPQHHQEMRDKRRETRERERENKTRECDTYVGTWHLFQESTSPDEGEITTNVLTPTGAWSSRAGTTFPTFGRSTS